ncbi:hypothetical protein Q5P01_002944 [Channa striata]|uniref:E3 ubiquitin-protein ligase Topors n=1 Tax=Channa striata TaxID=64152 RepID=A0AA88NTN6_CHASR|nr:hypothetical protein Q5P01_002944 [Channa striata]
MFFSKLCHEKPAVSLVSVSVCKFADVRLSSGRVPLTARSSTRRRTKNTDEKPPDRPGESAAQVMAPTRMKLRVRRRDNAAGGEGDGQPEEGGQRSRENVGHSSRRKNTSNSSTTTAAANSTSSQPTSTASASARAVVAAEEASPDSKCPICLDRFNNLAYLDRCLHRFCFPCIQEWSHNKPECPLCKQPFTSILHSVRAEDDFKEYTLRPTPANSSVAATVALVAAMASAARSDSQMRLTLRRHRGEDGRETSTRRRRRERGGRDGGSRRAEERTGVLEWYLDSHPPHHPPVSPVGTEESDEGEHLAQQNLRGGAGLAERGVIFEGLTGLGGTVAPVVPNDRASRRLMSRLAARQRLQREGGTVRRLREREMVAFRRALYRCGIQVRGIAGVSGNERQQLRDITAQSFSENTPHLNRLRPWLRRELTVLYGAHGVLVQIVQRIITARLAHHGLEDTPTIEEELRPFLLARTEHFLHELVSFARSPLSLDNYDLQAVYEPPAAALDLDGVNSSSDSSSVIAISEGEEDERQTEERPEDRLQERTGAAHGEIIQSGSSLSLSAWDDETPGPSYSTAEPSCTLASLSFSPAPQEVAHEGGGEKRDAGEGEEECLIVGYKKPIAERTPELVQLSSDTEEDEKEKKKEEEKVEETLPSLATTTPPLSYLPTVPPSTSGAYRDEENDKLKEKDCEAVGQASCARSCSGSSGKSHTESVLMLSACAELRETWRDRKQSGSEAAREKRKKRKRRKGRERSSNWLRKSGTLYNPNRSIYPAMMRRRSRTPSPFHSSGESGSPLPPSPPDSSWEYNCSPLTSSVSSASRTSSFSSPFSSSPHPSPPPQTPPTPSHSPSYPHHGEKPGGKRKYKSRHLDSNDKDPTWRPSSSHCREKRRKRGEKERKKKNGRDGGRRRERHRKDGHREGGDHGGESSSKKCREDRSPSVEIIYEGTLSSDPTRPSTCKRRRRRHRVTQQSSSPVIITLDSDSSHDDINNKHMSSSSSSPLSSQQTVDFSDLPPLPLAHSAGVGGALDSEIGELPVDILDRGSDGSETEPAGASESAGPITVDNSDNSDREVDVENVEESYSLQGYGDADNRLSSNMHAPVRKPDTKATTCNNQREAATVDVSMPTGENIADLITMDVCKRDSEVLTSDTRLLATILNDLKGINAPKCDYSLNFEASSPETRTQRFKNPCEVNQANSNKDSCLAVTSHTSTEKQRFNDVGDQSQGLDLPTCQTTIPLPPPPKQLKECSVKEEDRDLLLHLKQASPVQSDKRNPPWPLDYKDNGCAHLFPISPVEIPSSHTSDIEPVRVNSPVVFNSDPNSDLAAELPRNNQAIPPISALKKDFTNSLALRRELASTSSVSVIDMHSSCHLPATDSHSASPNKVQPLTTSSHSSHIPPIHSHPAVSENNSTDLDPNSSKLHCTLDRSNKTAPAPVSLPTDTQLVNSLFPVDFCSAKTDESIEKPTHIDSTSGGFRNVTLGQNNCGIVPIDLHSCSSVSAEGKLTGNSVFSGVKSNDKLPAVSVSSIDFKTQTPHSPTDSHLSDKSENLLGKYSISSLPTAASTSSFLPVDLHPRNPKSIEELTNNKVSLIVNHENRSPHGQSAPVHLCPVLPANLHSSSFINTPVGRHSNPTASSPSSNEHTINFHTSHRKGVSQSTESPFKHLHLTNSGSGPANHFGPRPVLQLPSDACSKLNLPTDSQPPTDSHPENSLKGFQLHTSNHIPSSPHSVEKQWNLNACTDAHPDPQLHIDEHSASSIWTKDALPQRTDK